MRKLVETISGKPIWLVLVELLEVSDQVLSGLVVDEHQHTEWNSWENVVIEDQVSGGENKIDWLDVSEDNRQNVF